MTAPVDPHEQTAAEPEEPAKPAGHMAAGRSIGGFQLISILGEGGMGVVWSAHDPNLDRVLAIKVLKRSDAAPALRMRLLREARAMARLKHPNVLTVYEVGTEGDRDFIAMEMVDGGSLDRWLAGQPPRAEVMAAILAAGRGLAAAHEKGLVHRDFKPHNVLRSTNGRVLVTDFGLARGMGEESLPGVETSLSPDAAHDVTLRPTSGARTNDSVLDSPLTHTGAMIGTPAYMAPEQFAGGAPDPRTDQFAFCVTAWEALTGARPYTGATLDELRVAAAAGVSPALKVDLAPEIRAALVRGMDPDPARRWPTLDDLLDVLDRAVRPRRARWIVPALALAAAALVAITVLATRRGTDAAVTYAVGCAPGEDGFTETWSPAIRRDLAKAIAGRGIDLSDAQFARLADPLDGYRERWTQAYATACKAPEKLGPGQRDCLLAARDQTAALVVVLREGPPVVHAKIDMLAMLPDLAICSSANPIAPPHPPTEPVLRDKVVRLLAKVLVVQGGPDFLAGYRALVDEAAQVGWPPMLALVHMSNGNELLRRGAIEEAREELQKVIDAPAEARDAKTLATARLGLLDASLTELLEPASTAKPGELHHELARLLYYVRADVKAAGNEQTLVASLATLEARAAIGLAQYGQYPRAYDEALAQARKARATYAAGGDLVRAARMSGLAAQILLARGELSALDDAMFEARSASEALSAAKLAPVPQLDRVRARIERQRGEYARANELFARFATSPATASGPTVRGTVLDPSGKPVANARVIAWRGQLVGDPKYAQADPLGTDGELVETDADGSFTIHGSPGDAILAERGDLRSSPIPIGRGAAKLVLAPTAEVLGTVEGPALVDVQVEARYRVGPHTWVLRVPVTRDRAFHLAGLPRGDAEIATWGDAGDGWRRVAAGPDRARLVWPLGQGIEIIARGPLEPEATAWIFRGKRTPKRRDEAEALAEQAPEVAWAVLGPVGANNTDAGRAVYQTGDQHALVTGNRDGEVSVCLARTGAPEAPVTCKRLVIAQTLPPVPGAGPRVGSVTTVILSEEARGTPAP